jgi:DNA-binding CsgD family transcriptional regulator
MLGSSNSRGAVQAASQAVDELRHRGNWAWGTDILPPTIKAFLIEGRVDHARALVEESDRGLKGRAAPAAAASLLRCKGLLEAEGGKAEGAIRLLKRAEGAWRSMGRVYEALKVREELGDISLAVSSPQAQRCHSSALVELEAIGAKRDADRIRMKLRTVGVLIEPKWRGGRRGYGDALSPREEEVARLAASGNTNRQIAQALFLSPRTVEHHLQAAMRKLDIRTRRELDDALSDQVGALPH